MMGLKLRLTQIKMTCERGFTLMEMLMGVAIGGVVLAAATSGLTSMMNMRKVTDAKTETSLMTDRLMTMMSNKSACKASMSSQTYKGDAPLKVNVDGLTEGSMLNGKFKVGMLTMEPSGLAPATMPNNKKLYLAYLKYQMETNLGSGAPYKSKIRSLPIRIVTDNSNAILECQSKYEGEDLCVLQGRTWDAAGPVGLQCKPKDFCQYAGAYSPAGQGGFINRVTGGYSCPAGFAGQRSGTVAYAHAAGKQAQTVSNAVISCVRCGPPLIDQGVNNGQVIITNDWQDAMSEYQDAVDTQYEQIHKIGIIRNEP